MESDVQPTNAGHPWLSERNARYQFLMRLIATSDEVYSPLNSKSDPDQLKTASAVFSDDSINPTQELLAVFKALLNNPGQPIRMNEFHYTRSEIDSTQLEKEVLSELVVTEEAITETALCALFTHLSSQPESDATISLQLLSQIVLQLHIRRSVKPLPSTVLQCFNEMISSLPLKNFVLERLLPAILLCPGHRQCSFVMNLLRILSPDSKATLLRALCTIGTAWPTESYPILQSLLEDHNTDHWTSELYILVCNAFAKQTELNPALHKSTQFANLLIQLIRKHGSKISNIQSWSTLECLTEQNQTFLRTPLLNAISSHSIR